jgi:hypothetical protein
MPRTSTRVQFGLFAIEIRQDSEPSTAEELQPFAKLEDLKSGAFNPQPFASFEPDYWLLDGSYKFLPDDYAEVHLGLVSTQMSNEDGDFAVPPVLTVDFSRAHDANGLTLKFSTLTGDYCSSLNIKYYDPEDTLLADNDYQPTGTEFTTGLAVEGFDRIVITFYSTSRPYRYLRLSGIDYGELFTFEGEAIKAASVVEESDPLSSELRINTLRLRLYSADAQFNPLDPQGDYAALAERQPLAVYEIVDGNPVFIGQYFLREWKNDSETEIEFEADDLLGMMDQIPCRGGLWNGADLGDLVEAFLGAASIPYELDPSLETVKITGWIPAGSLRETLQQLAFAAGAQVSCARSWGVRIFPARLASVETPADEITRAQIGARPQLTLRPQIAGVEVAAHKFVASNTTQELFNDSLAAGQHEIVFRQPMHSLSVTGATIAESGVNYARLNVAAPGTVTLSGKLYIDTAKTHTITNPSVTGSIKPIVRVKDATLVHAGNVAAVAQRIYDYYQQRLEQKIKLFAPAVQVGDCALVDTLYGRQIRAVIEKMDIDLGMGMTAKVELAGVAVDE